jgi:DNA polymerase-3 subunit gamma/tau
VNEDEFGEELLQKYTTRWSAEEIQLYYQILLQGRRDLLICPDEASGFEMLMLRLLAFSPQSEDQQANVEQLEVKKKPEAELCTEESASDPVTPQPEIQVNEATPEAGTQTSEQATPTPKIQTTATTVSEPEVHKQQRVTPEPTVQANGQTDTVAPADAPFNWHKLAYQLGLAGLAQEIVANSLFKSYQDGALRLQLLPEIHELTNDLIKTEIMQALEQKLEVSLRLELVAAASLAGQTPLQARELRQQQERLAAIDAIREEKTVRKLQHAFAAELDEASVVKIENNSY